ncbi:MAG: hypothetical protein ACKN8W_06260 [Actinomycetales bacterium]
MKINVRPNSNLVADSLREKYVAEPGFGKYFTDHMVTAEWNQQLSWNLALHLSSLYRLQ